MKHTVRSFSIGLFTSSLILLVIFLMTDSGSNTANGQVDEMIDKIEAEGYHVLTQSDYISLSVKDDTKPKTTDNNKKENVKQDKENSTNQEADKQDTKQDKKNDKDKDKDKEQNKEKKTYTITIKSGMLPSEISEQLEKNGIVKDAFEFSQFMEKKGYQKKVQLGKFKVSSDMSPKEIAESITK